MTIDEAIYDLNNHIGTRLIKSESKKQLAEWLEELKEFRKCVKSKAFVDGYEKGRADVEIDFQNSDYLNDYLAEIKKQIRADVIDEIRDSMDFHQKGLSGYFTISLDDWNNIEFKIGV